MTIQEAATLTATIIHTAALKAAEALRVSNLR